MTLRLPLCPVCDDGTELDPGNVAKEIPIPCGQPVRCMKHLHKFKASKEVELLEEGQVGLIPLETYRDWPEGQERLFLYRWVDD